MVRDVAGRLGMPAFGGLLCWNAIALASRGEYWSAGVALLMGVLMLKGCRRG